MISRRFFLAATASFALTPKFVAASDEVPKMLDHILLGCNNLDRGIDFVEKHTGVRAAFGGVHPGRGTRNALLSLGEKHYLEIIAPDPQQSGAPDHYGLLKLTEPRLVGWAAHPGDLNQFAARLRDAGIAFDGPNPGSRKRLDGRLLQWKTLNLKDDQSGLLPFFIEWSADTVHPSVDAPSGCKIVRFDLRAPNDAEINRLCALLNLDVPIAHNEKPQFRARISGPGGRIMELSSRPPSIATPPFIPSTPSTNPLLN
jgi:catechol 2,3-dioxygenase-like lactoylglutathione lyase family enzyme